LGYGPWSNVFVIYASSAPGQMTAVTTSIDVGLDATKVKIVWLEPAVNGATIDAYEILIRHKDGIQYIEDTTNCHGTSNTIVAAKQCLIPLTTLRSSSYNLVYNDLVVVRARAKNNIGWG